MMIKELQAVYGGFIDDSGNLVLQCPFHGSKFPSVLVWEEAGVLRFECKVGCGEEMLRQFFLNKMQKIYYMPDWRKSIGLADNGISIKWAESCHKRFFASQINMLIAIKNRLRSYAAALVKWNEKVSVDQFFEKLRYKSFVRYLIRLLDEEKERCEKEMKKKLNFAIAAKRKGGITPAMIEAAKSVPVDMLYDFRNGKAICPFHDDHEPSLVVWREKNLIRCFGCNKTWDAIQFIMDLKNMSFKEAVSYLCSL